MSAQRAADPEQELIEAVASFQHDPLRYVLYVFPWGEKGTALEGKALRTWQRKFLVRVGEKLRAGAADAGEVIRMARASGHGIGKSALVAMLIKWAFDTFEDTRGVVTANTDNQLRTKTWAEVSKWHEMSLTKHWATLTATALISSAPGHDKTWRIDAVPWSEGNTEAFAGLHNEGKRLLLIFDEASAIADKVWEVAEGALTDQGTEILWAVFGNATRNTGEFRECFRKHARRWDCEQIDSRTVEGTNLVELQKMVDAHGEDSDRVKVRIRGLFPSMSAKQFISQKDADAAYGRHLRPEQYNWAPKILTLDPAWEGDDELVFGLRQGLMFRVLRTMSKNDNDVLVATILAQLEDEHKADAVFIDAGYGTGVKSVGTTWGRDWRLVWFAAEAGDRGCLNKRAEMWKLTRDWLKDGGAIEEDPQLLAELTAPETVARVDGKIQIESKKDMKKRGQPSPNRADALVLSFAYPVQARQRFPDGTPMASRDQDNYADRKADGPYNPMR
ncbi:MULTISPECIES: terminase [unclassified Xanthomonas]|uniref:terminase n=1 Tax=unclassified Xanthomonas TaxID=2643310 RepID=UPI002A821225|nr:MULTISPECIES: terminase [unclassified Xanthomonas]MDY4297528.1 terminase [Xanthomonas sp. LF02-5]MDY4359322.1 terminase [Xanthomonas sp. LF04-12]